MRSFEFETVRSSALSGVAYDAELSTLAVRFHDGREYAFYAVPRRIHRELMTAESKGRYFQKHVRGAPYPHERLR